MTSTLLTGQESTRELLNLRRDKIHERRMKQASLLIGSAHSRGTQEKVIPFPAPDYPRIA